MSIYGPVGGAGSSPSRVAAVNSPTPANQPADAPPGSDRTLRLGSSGPDVAQVQKQLNQLAVAQGDPGGAVTVNGEYGPRTMEAVRRFQLVAGIRPADGQVNLKTAQKLSQASRLADGFDSGSPRSPTALVPPLPGAIESLVQGAKAQQRADQANKAGVRAPQGLAQDAGRVGELHPVPPSAQRWVEARIRVMLNEKLSRLSPAEQARLKPLVDSIGKPDFYEKMAMVDPQNAAGWREMAKTQAAFAQAEPGYDATTRAYSESMRLTLHVSAVLMMASDPNNTRNHYDEFIAGHVTAFRENGGYFHNLAIGVGGSVNVLRNTPLAMAKDGLTLGEAAVTTNNDPNVRTAAEIVRRARAEAIRS